MKISVVIPVYNTEKYLTECVESLVDQTVFSDMELILVDDGSDDGSVRMCNDFAEQYKNIKVIHKSNGGVSAARNTGLDAARGEFVGFVDSDDMAHEQMYEKLLMAIEETGADMSLCDFEHPYPGKAVHIKYPFFVNCSLDREYIRTSVASFMLQDSSLNSLCNKLFRRSVIEENSLRLTKGKRQGEDRELLLKFLTRCNSICYVPYEGYFYRYVESSAVHKPRNDYASAIFVQHKSDRELFCRLGLSEEEFERLSLAAVAEQLLGTLSFVNTRFRGRERRSAMHGIIDDPDTKELVSEHFNLLIDGNSRFNTLLIAAMRDGSVFRIRIVFTLMKIKVAAYNCIRINTRRSSRAETEISTDRR